MPANYVESETNPAGIIVGIVIGSIAGLVLILSFVAFCIRSSKRRVAGDQLCDFATDREDHPEGLPTYNDHGANQLIQPSDILEYNIPVSFNLVAAAPPSVYSRSRETERMSTYERMRRVQLKLDELKKLTALTSRDEYGQENADILWLRAEISKLMDSTPPIRIPTRPKKAITRTRISTHPTSVLDTTRVTSVFDTDAPRPNTLYARMVEMQEVLARIDGIENNPIGPAQVELTSTLSELKKRIATLKSEESFLGYTGEISDQRELGTSEVRGVGGGRPACRVGNRPARDESLPPPYQAVASPHGE